MMLARTTFLLLVSTCQYAHAQLVPPVDRSSDQIEILKALADVSKAYVVRDPLPFEQLYLENYAGIREKPAFNLREQLIAMMRADSVLVRAGKRLDYETLSYENETPKIHFYGHSAIVSLTKKNLWQYNNRKCMTTTQATELWIKREGSWKAAAGHATNFQCDPKPYHPIHHAVASIPARSRAPLNTDLEAEQQVRDLINSLVKTRSAVDEPFDSAAARFTSKNFFATTVDGAVVSERDLLERMPAISSARSSGLRNHDNALVIYDTAAIYTFRFKTMGVRAPAEGLQQCTVFFAKNAGSWMIVAAHASRYSAD